MRTALVFLFAEVELHRVTAAAPPLIPDNNTLPLHTPAPLPRDTPPPLATDVILSLPRTNETFLIPRHSHPLLSSPRSTPILHASLTEIPLQAPPLAGPAPINEHSPERGVGETETRVLYSWKGAMSAEMVRDFNYLKKKIAAFSYRLVYLLI